MRATTVISAGLFAAWTAHDLEELLTMSANSRQLAARAPAWLPIPDDVRRNGLPQEQVTLAIGLVGALTAAAAADGVRTRGRSAFFQLALEGFGWHGLSHLASAAAVRGYTSGVATAPVIVLPYWWWARRALRRAGVPRHDADPRWALALSPLLPAAHLAARALLRATPTAPAPTSRR
ncbi:MAG: HXXEE domain-containing protein [Kineosporiaceae bacterium]|nr:HXXEE domain-containing protein [Kineosporiaceae bacterium]